MAQPLLRLSIFVSFCGLCLSVAPPHADLFAQRPAWTLDAKVTDQDWPWWRGPQQNGIAAEQSLPLGWSESQGVVWKATVAGLGHGSPTVVGEHVFLATADVERQSQSVMCLARASGKLLWETVVHQGGLASKSNKKASQASSTIACDGDRLYINFLNRDAVFTTCLNLQGKILWQTRLTDYVVHQGYGSSPTLYRDLVLVSADNKAGGMVGALDRATGAMRWKRERPQMPNYASPIVVRAYDRDQLIMIGCERVTSLNPTTGETNWEVAGATTECVTSTLSDGELVYSTGGYPRNHVAAVRADGSGQVVWENTVRVYVPSMLIRDQHLYAVTDAGVAMCWNARTGDEMWKGRLGGTFTASPVLVGDKILAINESGQASIFAANPDKFQLLARNELPIRAMASPVVCGGQIFLRGASEIYCIGEQSSPEPESRP